MDCNRNRLPIKRKKTLRNFAIPTFISIFAQEKKKKGKDMSRMISMDENVCDNDLVFGSCYARSCIEVPYHENRIKESLKRNENKQ